LGVNKKNKFVDILILNRNYSSYLTDKINKCIETTENIDEL